MLPDFPKSRNELSKQLLLRLRLQQQAKGPIAEMGTQITQHEGTIHSYDQFVPGGKRVVTEGFEEIRVPVVVDIKDIPKLVGPELLRRIDALAEAFARQQSQILYKKLNEVTREAGTAIDAGGSPMTQEMFLAMFESMDMSFDSETGRPDLVFVAHPVMAEAMQKLWAEWEKDRDFMKRYKDVLTRKREEWRDRESRRKLVD